MKALTHDGKVVDIKEQPFEVHPSMKWVDCPDDIKIGFLYDGKTFKSNEQTPEEIFKIDRMTTMSINIIIMLHQRVQTSLSALLEI